jgi:RNA polymerase sigma factor (sigma-70 family)
VVDGVPVRGAERRRARGRLVALLDRLPPRQREVIELVWLEHCSRPDAARQLGITEGALRIREKRALDILKERMG